MKLDITVRSPCCAAQPQWETLTLMSLQMALSGVVWNWMGPHVAGLNWGHMASRQDKYEERRFLQHIPASVLFLQCRKDYMKSWNHTYTSPPQGSSIRNLISRSSVSSALPQSFVMLESNESMKHLSNCEITSFPTPESGARISWTSSNGFRVKKKTECHWILRASYWLLSLFGSL